MRKLLVSSLALLSLGFGHALRAQDDCSTYNFPWNSPEQVLTDSTGHLSNGAHYGAGQVTGSCTYSGAYISHYCGIECASTYTGYYDDTQALSNPLLTHVPRFQPAYGGAGTNGGGETPAT